MVCSETTHLDIAWGYNPLNTYLGELLIELKKTYFCLDMPRIALQVYLVLYSEVHDIDSNWGDVPRSSGIHKHAKAYMAGIYVKLYIVFWAEYHGWTLLSKEPKPILKRKSNSHHTEIKG